MCFYYFCFESIFDPKAPFARIPLYMAHPVAIPPQPYPPASPESDLSVVGASTSSPSHAPGGDDDPPGGSRSACIMEDGFLSSEFAQGSLTNLEGCNVNYTEWPSFGHIFV